MLKTDHNNFFLINWWGNWLLKCTGVSQKKASVELMQKFPVQTLSEHEERDCMLGTGL